MEESRESRPRRHRRHPVERMNVLLVDDHAENLLALEAVLGDLGQNIVMASSGTEALRCLLAHEDFGVILLDTHMPDMNGYKTAELIRARPQSQHTPIVFMSEVNRMEAQVFRGYELGAIDYLFVPFLPEILRAKVMVFLELHRRQQRLLELERQVNERNLDELEQRLGGEQTERVSLEMEERMATLRRAQRFYQSVLDALPLCLAVLDEAGAIMAVNGSWGSQVGHPLVGGPLIVGTNYLAVCDSAPEPWSEHAASLSKGIRDVLTFPGSRPVSLEYPGPRGKNRWWGARLARFRDEEGSRVVVSHEDVTDRHKAADQHRALMQRIQAAQRLGSRGLGAGNMSQFLQQLLREHPGAR